MPSAMIMQIWTSAKSASMRGRILRCFEISNRRQHFYFLPESDTSLRVLAELAKR